MARAWMGGAWVIIVCPAVTRCAGEGGLATDVLGRARQGGASFSRGAGGGGGRGEIHLLHVDLTCLAQTRGPRLNNDSEERCRASAHGIS